MPDETYHIPVLLKESVDALNIDPSGVYADATLGGGGHCREILSRLGPKGRLIAFDRDKDALKNAPDDERVTAVHSNYRFIHHFLRLHGVPKIDGILADLGVSSHQFDTSERGFSFRFEDSVLDMRMNASAGKSAKEILNTYREEELASVLYTYGELQNSRKAASLICAARRNKPIVTSADLTAALAPITPPVNGHRFLAKVYQALRIEVNNEMDSLEHFLKGCEASLNEGGRLSVITYHSIEDRIVKNFLREGAGEEVSDTADAIYGRRRAPFRQVNKHPLTPSEGEIAINTRSRSAKLRIGERTGGNAR